MNKITAVTEDLFQGTKLIGSITTISNGKAHVVLRTNEYSPPEAIELINQIVDRITSE